MTTRTRRWCALLVCLGPMLIGLASGVAENAMLNQCTELKAQEHLDLKEVMGKWYVVEVMEHRGHDPRQQTSSGGGSPGTTSIQIDACPIVKMRFTGTNNGLPVISLLWEEEKGSLEYTFLVSGNHSLSVWNSNVPQNGTLASKPTYRQFHGTAHVMKAIAAHMVLTFCPRNTEDQKFSVLLGREHKLSHNDLRGVHNLMVRRNLQLLTIRKSCANGAASSTSAWFCLVGLGLLLATVGSERRIRAN